MTLPIGNQFFLISEDRVEFGKHHNRTVIQILEGSHSRCLYARNSGSYIRRVIISNSEQSPRRDRLLKNKLEQELGFSDLNHPLQECLALFLMAE